MLKNKYRNTILQSLDEPTLQRLHLEPVELPVRHPLETPGKAVRHIFFLEAGVASVTTCFADGFEVEAGMYGFDSLSGISAFMGMRQSLNASYMQIAGHGFSCEVEHARAEFQRAGRFNALALRAVQAQFSQSMQSAGCNAHHEIGPRLARWLLLCADKTDSEVFALSHEFLSSMLGSRRSTVTVAAGVLKNAQLIRYTRGAVEIVDRHGLEAQACECYKVLRDYLRDGSEYNSGLARLPG
jgi:CRP-like cAMP-binding protein